MTSNRETYIMLILFELPIKDDGKKLQCCNPDGSSLDDLPTECLPIKAPQNESESKHRCFSSPRAADTSDIGCNIQPVRQVNHYIFIITNCATHLYFKSICNYFEFFFWEIFVYILYYIATCLILLFLRQLSPASTFI